MLISINAVIARLNEHVALLQIKGQSHRLYKPLRQSFVLTFFPLSLFFLFYFIFFFFIAYASESLHLEF